MTEPNSRRPIASRSSGIAQRAAQYLAETSLTPNQISMASIGFAALAGLAFCLSGQSTGVTRVLWLVCAALGCQLRLLCNLFDGMVAIEGGKSAPDGPFWNEAPDRFADILILVGIGLGAGFAALGWATAALAILTAYIREVGASQGMPADFSGPMAKPQRMATATLAAIIAIFAPVIAGVDPLVAGLWIIAIGSLFTALGRSKQLVDWLKNHKD